MAHVVSLHQTHICARVLLQTKLKHSESVKNNDWSQKSQIVLSFMIVLHMFIKERVCVFGCIKKNLDPTLGNDHFTHPHGTKKTGQNHKSNKFYIVEKWLR